MSLEDDDQVTEALWTFTRDGRKPLSAPSSAQGREPAAPSPQEEGLTPRPGAAALSALPTKGDLRRGGVCGSPEPTTNLES